MSCDGSQRQGRWRRCVREYRERKRRRRRRCSQRMVRRVTPLARAIAWGGAGHVRGVRERADRASRGLCQPLQMPPLETAPPRPMTVLTVAARWRRRARQTTAPNPPTRKRRVAPLVAGDRRGISARGALIRRRETADRCRRRWRRRRFWRRRRWRRRRWRRRRWGRSGQGALQTSARLWARR